MSDRPVAFDLQVYRDRTWDVKVSETETLRVRKPSERVLIRMMDAQTEVEKAKDDPRSILPLITEFLALALSNNRDNVEVDEAWFEERDIDLMTRVDMFKAYGAYVTEVMSSPNSNSPH